MAGGVFGFIFLLACILVPLIIMTTRKSDYYDRKKSYDYKPRVTSVDLARAYEKEKRIQKEAESLKAEISNHIDLLKNRHEDKEVNSFYISEYEALLNRPIFNEDSLNEVSWQYNHGNLRTEGEYKIHSGRLEKEFKDRSHLYSITLFLIGYLPILFWFKKEFHDWGFAIFISFYPGVFVGLILGLIGSAIAHALNSSEAKSINTPEADYMAKLEKVKMGVSIGAAAGGVIHTVSHAKKSVKDVANVDSWKEMK